MQQRHREGEGVGGDRGRREAQRKLGGRGEEREIRRVYEVDRSESVREREVESKKATREIERETRKRRRKAVVSMFSSSWIAEGV